MWKANILYAGYTFSTQFFRAWNRGSLLHILSCWFYFVSRIHVIYRFFISRGVRYAHLLLYLTVSEILPHDSLSVLFMFSRSDGLKWSYFRTCVFNPCVNFASKGNSCSYYKHLSNYMFMHTLFVFEDGSSCFDCMIPLFE